MNVDKSNDTQNVNVISWKEKLDWKSANSFPKAVSDLYHPLLYKSPFRYSCLPLYGYISKQIAQEYFYDTKYVYPKDILAV